MTRNDAIALRLLTYETGKPCRHGHLSPRYTSTAGCVACLTANGEKRAATNRSLRIERNSARGGGVLDAQLYSRALPADGHSTMDACREICIQGTLDQRNRLVALMNEIADEINLARVPRSALHMHGRTLTTADVTALMQWDGTRSGNYTEFAMIERNLNDPMDDSPGCIELGRHWYDADAVLACLRGQVRTVDPIMPTPAMMARYRPGVKAT